ncbi:drug/metabolite transporter (DMT)-like permease [Planifilum fimeticola]|uniref:Drug/metabolite transporter (DMT)-like permease n=1 Tax=Planifilum fimeticola TaxID=201975 RepID=A0A2T0LB98_9BACL|nr:DMT family transporter [Planifilum fimeticola]PRX39154.1 drug/metabolite transporter (DMT)-like permease [Planifilum fimeticola]
MTAKNKGSYLMLLAVTVIWGYTWVAQKLGLHYMGPFSFSVFRFGLGSLILIGLILLKKNATVAVKDLPALILLGLLMTTATFSFWMVGMRDVSAGTAALIAYTMPMWTMLLAHRFLGEPLTVQKGAGLAAGLGGLALIAGPSAASGQDLSGAFLVLLGSISWAASNVLTKARFSKYDMLAVTGIQMFFGAVGLFLLTLLFEPSPLPERWTPELIALILFTGILASAFSFFAWFYTLSRLPAGKTAVSVLLVPVFALLFDWLQMNEPITWETVAGCILVLTGIALVQRSEESKKSRDHGKKRPGIRG